MTKARLHVITLAALALMILSSFVLYDWITIPRFQGRSVDSWFKEFRILPISMAIAMQPNSVTSNKNGRNIAMNTTSIPVMFHELGPGGRILRDGHQQPIEDEPMKALRALGSHSVEYLLNILNAKETPLRKAYKWFYVTVPTGIRAILPASDSLVALQYHAVAALAGMGEAGKPAISVLARRITEPKKAGMSLMRNELPALANLRPDSSIIDQIVVELCNQSRFDSVQEVLVSFSLKTPAAASAVIRMIENGNSNERNWAYLYLINRLGPAAYPTVPLLVKNLSSEEKETRYLSARALACIGTNAIEAIPALTQALNDSDVMVQSVAERTLKSIQMQLNFEISN